MNTPPAPQHRLADLRDWLMDQIDGSEETRGDDGLISDFIRQIDALSEMGTTVEPRGCPTPGACSCPGTTPSDPAAATPITQALVSMLEAGWLSLGSSAPGAVKPLIETLEAFERELIDIKQRLLPQYLGRAERAERELAEAIRARDAAQTAAVKAEQDAIAAESQLAEARKTINQIKLGWEPAPSATVAPNEAAAWKWGYEYLQERMKTIGRDGWAHDCDSEIEARIDAAPVESATAEPKPVDAEAIVASCCGLFDCRPSDLRSKIVELQRTAAPVEEVAISRDLWLFLKGESTLDGFWFGEYPIGKPHYWWRSYMKGEKP